MQWKFAVIPYVGHRKVGIKRWLIFYVGVCIHGLWMDGVMLGYGKVTLAVNTLYCVIGHMNPLLPVVERDGIEGWSIKSTLLHIYIPMHLEVPRG